MWSETRFFAEFILSEANVLKINFVSSAHCEQEKGGEMSEEERDNECAKKVP